MPVTPKHISLTKVIEKIEGISNIEYGGDTRSHIKEIFDRLTIRERRLILQAFIDMTALMKQGFSESEVVDAADNPVEEEIDDIDKYNAKELVRLKIWLSKAVFVLLLILMTVGSSILYFIDPSTTGALTEKVSNFIKVLKVVFG